MTMNKHGGKNFRKSPALPLLLGGLLLLTGLLALRAGSAALTWNEFRMGLLRRPGFEKQSLILYTLRLPRILGGMLAGMGLAVSGALLQQITGNDLAGPNIIGINAGAGLAVILLLWLNPAAARVSPLAAFAGAFLTALFIVTLANRIRGGRTTVILAGIAVTALLNAGISFISLMDTDVLAAYNAFSVGGLSAVTMGQLALPAGLIAAGIVTAVFFGGRIDTLCLGDEMASSLGVRVRGLRVLCLVIASACAAAAVSFAGLLGFVGLVVPHMARRITGVRTGRLIPVAAMLGGILVVLADLAGRVIIAPSEVPVGIVMALLGAPFFFALLLRRNRHAEI